MSPPKNVIVADSDIYVVEPETLQRLRQLAADSPLKRSRICLHRTSDDPIQEMVILFDRDTYVRVHRHRNKSESFHVVEGLLQVIFFDDQGVETQRISLGAPGTGRPSLYRLACDAWHTVLVESDWGVIHETTNGPFVPGDAQFAPWAPDGNDAAEATVFLESLRTGSPRQSGPAGSAGTNPADSRGAELVVDAKPSSSLRSPTLTTIICNYNHGRSISRAIEAMLTQSRPADEFIIVDDGSTDDSLTIIRSWVEKYPQIRLLVNERNLGFHASFQRAITVATGDFVYSGAADDRILPGFFAGAMQLAEQYPSTGIISGQFVSVDPLGQPLGTSGLKNIHQAIFLEPSRYLHEVLEVEPATHSLSAATLFRRIPLIEIGGCPQELESWGDTFAIQTLGLRHGFCYWPFPAMEWTINPGSLSQETRSNPLKGMRILERAKQWMRSERFRNDFPEDYVERWSQDFLRCIVHEQLSPAIEGNQAFQKSCRRVAATASPPARLLLLCLCNVMRVLYFVTFRVMRRAATRRLRQMYMAEEASKGV
ncbi:WbuC family cupin fold metalloprotein [Schlesneria sp. T3-172]|uniref:WbuC family cupin fold metalloprotein n=1 Tax=Schlesneria sphaerica TaxID=3373610 RepID=UPI0037CA1700